MRRMPIPHLTAIILALAVVGCGGPSKKGREARGEANSRMNLTNSRIAYEQAEQAFLAGQFDRAMREIGTAISRSPDQAPYKVLLGRILLETHRMQSALDAFDAAIVLDEGLAEAHYYRGIVLQRWGRHDQSADAYARAFELDASRLQYLLAAAEAEVATDRVEAARLRLLAQVANFENHAALHQLLGQIAMMQGEFPAAVQRFRRAQLLAPDDRMLLEELRRAQQRCGDLAGALSTVRRLQSLSATPCRDLLRLEARCLAELARYAEARSVYIELTRQHPEDLDAFIELAGVAHHLGDQRRLQQCAARIAMLAPDRWESPFFRALVERSEGRGEDAVRELQRAIELAPRNATPRVLLGIEHQRAGRLEDAYRAFAGVLRLEPDHPIARRLIAQVDPEIDARATPAAPRAFVGVGGGFSAGLD